MKSWRRVWREGFVPELSTHSLQALALALATDDPKIIQGATTFPPRLLCVEDWPVEGACAISYCGWRGEKLDTVGKVGEFFSRVCLRADTRMKDAFFCSGVFLDWFDKTPRTEMIRKLLPEVELALVRRRLDKTANEA